MPAAFSRSFANSRSSRQLRMPTLCRSRLRSRFTLSGNRFIPLLYKVLRASAAVPAFVMAACSADVANSERAEIEQDSARASDLIAEFGSGAGANGGSRISDRMLVAVEPFSMRSEQDLPERLLREDAVTLASRTPLDLAGALVRLALITGVPHAVSVGPDGRIANPGNAGVLEEGAEQLAAVRKILEQSGLGGSSRVEFEGSLPSVLDALAAARGLEWSYDGDRVLFRQFVLRRYRIAALPTEASVSSKVGAYESSASIDLASDVEASLRLAAGSGSVVSFSRGTGIATINATPEAQRRVARLVASLNSELTAQIAFDVNILTVNLSMSESRGVDVRALVGKGSGSTVSWTGKHEVASSPAVVNIGVIEGKVDIEAVVRALSRTGGVSVETRAGAATVNNRIVPVEVVRQTAYARKVEAVPGEDGATRTTIEPGMLTTGLEMHLLPRLLNDQEIFLRFGIELSDLNELAEFTSDRQTIQLPKVSTTSFEQSAILGNGQILILAGFERDRTVADRSSGGDGFGALFGGKSEARIERISTVLLIRPRILGRPRAEGVSILQGAHSPEGAGL